MAVKGTQALFFMQIFFKGLLAACFFVLFFFLLLFFRNYIIPFNAASAGEGLFELFLELFSLAVLGFIAVLVTLIFYTIFIHKVYKKQIENMRSNILSHVQVTREQLEMLYEHSPMPYFLMDEEGKVRNPNKAALRLFAGTIEECELINFFSVIVSPNAGGRGEDFAELLRMKVERDIPVSNVEVCIKTQKENERWVRVSIFSLPRNSDVSLRHVVSLIDITHEREIEQTKTDFLLLASHQLRTPTTAIKWHVDYLRSLTTEKVSMEMRKYLDEIYAGNERMMDLIRTLLTVSRIEMGTLDPEYVPLRVRTVLEDILDELATNIQKKDMRMHIELAEDDKVTTDRMMFRIVLHNLLTNAIKYTPREGDVYVSLESEAHACTITVRDTGGGIPAREQDQIFRKMFRASNARKISAQGTGLGLYLTKAFIEKLGGTISFVSAEGAGTTFTIHIPRVAPGA